jgi:microcystin-dependent protein
MWAGAIASTPSGWLACNGANVSRTTYSALFAVVGTTWGAGDGSTTFTLPNLLNRFPVGAGDTYALAATGGSADAIVVSHTHTYSGTVDSAGTHSHTIGARDDTVGVGDQVDSAGGAAVTTVPTSSAGAHVHTYSGTTASSGSSATNANLPPYVAVGYIIKT